MIDMPRVSCLQSFVQSDAEQMRTIRVFPRQFIARTRKAFAMLTGVDTHFVEIPTRVDTDFVRRIGDTNALGD
jgi:hypothetical protein